MPTQQNDQMCGNVVQKLTLGEPLDDAEKTHLATCEDCMAQIVKTLDESAASEANGHAGVNGDLTHARPEAKKALEQGRKVFEREFGITLPTK